MIKYLDLKRINESFEPELSATVAETARSGWYLFGERVRGFERDFARYCGVEHCVGVGNGLDALTLIFMAYVSMGRLQKGDEVITDDGIRLVVESLDKNRVESVHVYLPEVPVSEGEPEEDRQADTTEASEKDVVSDTQ